MTEGTAPSVPVPAPRPAAQAAPSPVSALDRTAFRLVLHLAVWAPFVTGVVLALRENWRPVGDGASIALRSWDVLTAHGPLVGQANRLGYAVFDPGPLQYWLQAIPVHLDPRYGVLWAAALWCMIAASAAIEAAWSALGGLGGLLAAVVILGTVVWQPRIAVEPFWNPWFGVVFFLAALAAGWAVLSGRRWWWVVLVVAGSVASQAHLMFALASAGLILLALAVGLADTHRGQAGYRWAITGLVAGVGCWIAPLVQEVTGRPGNLTSLLSGHGTGRPAGLAFGLKTITASTQPPALWWTPAHALGGSHVASLISGRPAWFAVAALALEAMALVAAAGPLRSRRLAALAAVSLLASAATVVTYSRIPVSASLATLDYLDIVLFPLGALCWLTVGSATVLTGRQVTSRLRPGPAVPGDHGSRSGLLPGWAVRVTGVVAAAVLGLASSLTVAQQKPEADARFGSLIGHADQQVEGALPGQPVALSVANAPQPLILGIVWALRASGYRPEVSHSLARELGPMYVYAGQRIPRVMVQVHRTWVSVRVRPG